MSRILVFHLMDMLQMSSSVCCLIFIFVPVSLAGS